MMTFAWDLYNYFPDGYFEKAQAMLIRIMMPSTVHAQQYISEHTGSSLSTSIINNIFFDNDNYQTVTFKSIKYQASLLVFYSEMETA